MTDVPFPTLQQAIDEFSDLADGFVIDPAAPAMDLGIDSLIFLEWMYGLEERYGFVFDDNQLVDALKEDMTFGEMHAALWALAREEGSVAEPERSA